MEKTENFNVKNLNAAGFVESLFDSNIIILDSSLNIKASFSNEKSDYLKFLERHLSTAEAKKGPLITSFLKSRIVINNDTLKNPLILHWKEELVKRSFLSNAAVPVVKKGKTIGVLSLYANEREFFKEILIIY